MGMGFGFNFMDSFMFTVFPIVFMVMFVTVFIIFVITIVSKFKQNAYNKTQPVLTVEATIADKRSDHSTSHHHNTDGMSHTSHYTHYYVTFQVESGDRMEFEVDDREFGMLVAGDRGRLTFQGTAYRGFTRQR